MTDSLLDKEEAFHDDWADSIKIEEVMVDEFFEAETSPENTFIIKQLGDIRGKRVLELGCGAGEASIYLAKKGAVVTATDISCGMLDVVKKVAALHKVEVATKQCYSHTIPFDDGSFDIVYAANLLHHVDIDTTLKEVSRVLKKGGTFACWDPLAHNPLINIYRRMATEVRTDDEHPLRMKDLKLFDKYFSKIKLETTWLFTLWIFMRFYIEGADPNKERYWKKILVEHERLAGTYNRLKVLDRFFLTCLPFLKRYCWNIVILGTK